MWKPPNFLMTLWHYEFLWILFVSLTCLERRGEKSQLCPQIIKNNNSNNNTYLQYITSFTEPNVTLQNNISNYTTSKTQRRGSDTKDVLSPDLETTRRSGSNDLKLWVRMSSFRRSDWTQSMQGAQWFVRKPMEQWVTIVQGIGRDVPNAWTKVSAAAGDNQIMSLI